MNLLVVDDEYLIVEDIKTSVDWESLGISNVYTAFNMRQAKEIFEKNKIHLMLCDIEMPQGSGLDLLTWVKEYSPKTEAIFLTCHADFGYAKEAVRLGSLDYILKPIPYDELEKAIKRAIDKISKENTLNEYSRYGQFWFKHQSILIERFWQDIVNQTIPPTPEEIKATADYRNIPYTNQMRILPVLAVIQKWHEKMSLQDEKIMEYGLKNVIEEMLTNGGNTGKILQLKNGELLGILYLENEVDLHVIEVEDICKNFISVCNQYLKCEVSCYIGKPIYAYELAAMVQQLSVMENNNVAFYNKVFQLNRVQKQSVSINTKDFSIWEVMIKKGLKESVIAEIKDYLEHLAVTTGLNANMLYQFRQSFIQMIYRVIEQKGIQAEEILGDTQFVNMQIQSAHSIDETIEWMRSLAEKIDDFVIHQNKPQMVVNMVKDYIKLHLDNELTREQISGYVYLNPDYLDRLFKKETGMSVAKYMMEERIKVACELLTKTNISISEIAVSVGYANLSNFSGMFRKATGYNPIEYRKLSIKTDRN